MNKKLVVLQEDSYDCAAASVLSIIKYYGGLMDLETIRELINTTKDGTTFLDISLGIKEIGLNSIGKKIKFDDLINESNIIPLIAHIKKDNFYHFVVIYNINNKKKCITIMDPGIGMYDISFEEFKNFYLGSVLIVTKEKELPIINKKNELLEELIKSIIINKNKIILLFFVSIIIFILSLSDSLFLKLIFDSKDINNHIVKYYIIIFLIILFIKNILIYFKNKLSINLSNKIDLKINRETIKRLFYLPYSYYKNKTTGEMVSRINDLNRIKDLLINLILNVLTNFILMLISIIIIFNYNKSYGIISLIVITSYYLVILLFKNNIKTKIRIIQGEKGKHNQKLIESIESIETINNINVNKTFISSLFNNYKVLNSKIKNINNFDNNITFIKNNIIDVGNILLIGIGFYKIVNNEITLGNFILSYSIISFCINSIKNILDMYNELYYSLSNISKINGLLHYKVDDTNKSIFGSIVINKLNYKVSNRLIIDNLNLVISENTFIKGSSGIGKSSLLKILLKYYTKYEGDITIDSKNLKDISDGVIRNSITYIGQNEKLFNDTFINNICLERNYNNEEIEKIKHICFLNEIEDKRKFKDDFIIEEGGFNLSGGERQRIILARGLLNSNKIIFIDETLSEVNLEMEMSIIKNIMDYYKDKLIVYVSHKSEASKLFNKVFDMERREYE